MYRRVAVLGVVCATLLPVALAAQAPLRGSAKAADWSAPFNCSASALDTENASAIADSSGRLHVVWSDAGEIMHRFRDAAGWSLPARVDGGYSPDVAADSSGRVYLAFARSFDGNDDVYFTSWQEGSGWDLPVNVSESADTSSSPRIALAPGGGLAIVWSEQSPDWALIFLGRSADGVLWSTAPVPNASGSRPVVACAGADDLWVVWQDVLEIGMHTEVFVSHWVGEQWTLPEDVSVSFEEDSVLPALAVGQGKAYLAWQEGEAGQETVNWSQWAAGAWSVPQSRSGSGQALAPGLALAASGDGYLVWTTESAVRCVTWSPTSGTWQPAEDVAVAQVGPAAARLALGDLAHLVWLAQASADNRDVYHSARSVSGATTPSPTATALGTATPTSTGTPTVTQMPSRTPTATLMATHTATPTRTSTPSRTPTEASTVTRTATATPTQQSAPTTTASATVTAAPSRRLWLPLMLRQARLGA